MTMKVCIDGNEFTVEYQHEHEVIEALERLTLLLKAYGVERGFQRLADMARRAGAKEAQR